MYTGTINFSLRKLCLSWNASLRNLWKIRRNTQQRTVIRRRVEEGKGEECVSESTVKSNTIGARRTRISVEAGEGGGFDWGGVEGWGENADNCNWTAIKEKKEYQCLGLE